MEFLSEFISFLVQCLFWYFIASLLIGYFQRNINAKEEELSAMREKLNDIIHRVKVEKHNDMYYWFDADDDEFLGQGKTIEEAVEQLRKRFPGHIFFVSDKDQSYKISGPDWKLQPFNVAKLKT